MLLPFGHSSLISTPVGIKGLVSPMPTITYNMHFWANHANSDAVARRIVARSIVARGIWPMKTPRWQPFFSRWPLRRKSIYVIKRDLHWRFCCQDECFWDGKSYYESFPSSGHQVCSPASLNGIHRFALIVAQMSLCFHRPKVVVAGWMGTTYSKDTRSHFPSYPSSGPGSSLCVSRSVSSR